MNKNGDLQYIFDVCLWYTLKKLIRLLWECAEKKSQTHWI